MSRASLFGLAALAALVVGWAQPMPAAEAGFDSAAPAATTVGRTTWPSPC